METGSKKCFKCAKLKLISDFYKHGAMGDGYLNKCIQCTKEDSKNNYSKKIEDIEFVVSERLRNRERMRGKVVKSKGYMKAYRGNHPEKYKATQAVCKIKVPKGLEKHHWSYNEEHFKDFIVLPISLHAKLHRYLIYSPKDKMYKTHEGTLLDSRSIHEKYISVIAEIF